MGSTASGSVIKNRFDGSYILTAAHVCDDSKIKQFVQKMLKESLKESNVIINYNFEFFGLTIDGKKHTLEIVAQDKLNDICLLWAPSCFKQALPISSKPPSPGDRVYNMAAPLGIFDVNMIPLQEGIYNGESKNVAFYSLPAVGGSSGSPIINHKSELVGMIHSTYRAFNHLSLSPTYSDLMMFIENELEKHITLHMINIYMRQLINLQNNLKR